MRNVAPREALLLRGRPIGFGQRLFLLTRGLLVMAAPPAHAGDVAVAPTGTTALADGTLTGADIAPSQTEADVEA